jgi:hypothetical protein
MNQSFIYRPAYTVLPGSLGENVYSHWEDLVAAIEQAEGHVALAIDDDLHARIPAGFWDTQEEQGSAMLHMLEDFVEADPDTLSAFSRAHLERLLSVLPLPLHSPTPRISP